MLQNVNDVHFGGYYQDHATGFTGVCTSKCTNWFGADQALLEPKMTDSGARVKPRWVEIQRLQAAP